MPKYIKPENMTADQRADWEAMGGAAAHPEGLLDAGAAAPPGGAAAGAPAYRPTHADREDLRRHNDRRCRHRDAMLESLGEAWNFGRTEMPAYEEAAEARARLAAEIDRNAARINRLKAKNMLLSAQLKGVGKSANEIKAALAKQRKMHLEAAKHEKAMLESRQKLIDLLVFLNAEDGQFMWFLGKTREMLGLPKC